MSFLQNPQQLAAAQQAALKNVPQALKILDAHTGDIHAMKMVIAAITAALSDNEAFTRELAQQLAKGLPQPGQIVPFDQQQIVKQAKTALRTMLPPTQAAQFRD